MMMRIAFFGALALTGLMNGCAGSREPAASSENALTSRPTIVTLRLRNGFVDIESGADGITYSVLDSEGKALASSLNEAELKAKFPEHFQAVEKALAGSEKAGALDASASLLETFATPRETGAGRSST